MRDFLPDDVRRREYVIGIIKRVYERYGFEPLETPAVENLETLLGKYGDEGNQLIFKILKRGAHEKTGEADLALRYDLTVPLARVIAHHQAKLPRLFKRYQIQPVWRADRPARGRFREFYQCDVDSIGSKSPTVETELCAAVSDALIELGFSDFTIRINHRQLLSAILRVAKVPEALHSAALVALDKLDKTSQEKVLEELNERGVSEGSARSLLDFLFQAGDDADPDIIATYVRGDEAGELAVQNLKTIRWGLMHTRAWGKLRFDPRLARGLSYYTGAIMEINVHDLAGSLGGGGRYDNLVGMFLGQEIPASGFSLGLERILVVMNERNMFPESLVRLPAEVMVAYFDSSAVIEVMRAADELRKCGLRVLVYPEADKIGKQLKYASSQSIPFVGILGGDEIESGKITVKNLETQSQETLLQSEAGSKIREALTKRG
jgi:histidyl-tRNA synthetase